MAATVTVINAGLQAGGGRTEGNRRRAVATVTFDTSYPSGGYAVAASAFDMTTLDTVDVSTMSQLGTHWCLWDQTNSKIKVFTALNTEVSNAVDIHTDSVVIEAIGV